MTRFEKLLESRQKAKWAARAKELTSDLNYLLNLEDKKMEGMRVVCLTTNTYSNYTAVLKRGDRKGLIEALAEELNNLGEYEGECEHI